MELIQLAIDKLANSMRIYGETRFNFERLKLIDLEEAVNNLDRAFEAKLEAFHSLYDVSKNEFEYFENADAALLIMLRNAVHHRNHMLFRSWNSEMILNDGLKRNNGRDFLLASHEVVDASMVMKFYYKLEDFYSRLDINLNSPYLENRMGERNREKLLKQIDKDLNFRDLWAKENDGGYAKSQIYINIIPIFISSVCKVFKAFKLRGIEFKGYDAKVYERPFTEELNVDLSQFTFKPIIINI